MELNNGHNHEPEDEDRLSMLPDDILLSILGAVNLTTAARTGILSTRWKHLPWLLHELTIDCKDFLSLPHPKPIEVDHMDKAMASLTKAARSFLLAAPRSESTITKLQIKLYMVNNYSDIIGPLVSQAIDSGAVEDLDLAIMDEKKPDDCYDEEMLQQACSVEGFFSAYPSLLHCLTRLCLYNICFAGWDIHHLLFDCCKQLQYLYLSNCDAGGLSAWKIDAPDSKLSVLELCFCCFGRLEILCLPKLERLRWDSWICPYTPLSFDVVPSLKELYFICTATVDHQGFKLSKVLRDTTSVENLTLNFHGEKIWEHPCIVDTEERRQIFGDRTNLSWKAFEFKSCKELLLREVQITGFSPMEQQMVFLRAVMGRAPNLRKIVLNDYQTCDYCEEIGALPRSERLPAERVFPKGKYEQDLAVEQLMRNIPQGIVKIIFGN